VSLRLLGERHGLWGPGRQGLVPSPFESEPEPDKEGFVVLSPPPKAN